MKKNLGFYLLVSTILLTSTLFSGCVREESSKPTGSMGLIQIPGLSAGSVNDPQYKLASFYKESPMSIKATSVDIALPLSLKSISNFDTINTFFDLSEDQQHLLRENGFVVIPFQRMDDIIEPYMVLKNRNIPLFVTTDTFLHLYHIQFNEILKGLEQRLFYQHILDISDSLFSHSKDQYQSFTDPLVKQAAKNNMVFFAVALELLHTPTSEDTGSEVIPTVDYSIPDDIVSLVEAELAFINAHQGFDQSPLFTYREDYSQYVPRGHYTDSEILRRYFKTLMWYGRMSFLLKGGSPAGPDQDFLVNKTVSDTQTMQAILIASALPTVTNEKRTLFELWEEIYAITSFFVGTSDDLTPYEYAEVITDVFGSRFEPIILADEDKLIQLKGQLGTLRRPEIYGGTGEIIIEKPPGVPFTLDDLNETLEKTQGMRLMGQRFIPDSYMFQQLVFPAVDLYQGSGDPKPFTMEYVNGVPT
ncbi:MAG: DUF3160 domain-containing protein, partial [Candidatus Thermoplasmatota archaeon]|nr:DUF3160 domain-containing protein [Candidatus Thermoplasmatota archaeon]